MRGWEDPSKQEDSEALEQKKMPQDIDKKTFDTRLSVHQRHPVPENRMPDVSPQYLT